MSKEAMKLALEALEETRNALAWFYDSYPQDVTKKGNKLLPRVENVLTTLREALAKQPAQQEPFGFMNAGHVHEMQQGRMPWGCVYPKIEPGATVAVYTSPSAQRPWVGLTWQDWNGVAYTSDFRRGAEWADAQLREKNT